MKNIFYLISLTMLCEGTPLSMVQNYALKHPEYHSLEKKTVFNVDYTNWYFASGPSFLDRIFSMIGLKKLWPVDEFKKLLPAVTEDRENAGYKAPQDILIRPKPGSQFILIGPLFGSFHSLVRIVTELHRQNYITQDFKLQGKDTYLIFIGNVVNESPTIIETLTLMLTLMSQNPDNVFYLGGRDEKGDAWKEYGLKKELIIRVKDSSYEALVSRFFSTLPQAFLLVDHSSSEAVSIIYDQESQTFDLTNCIDKVKLLPHGSLLICPLQKKNGTAIQIRAFITGEKRLMNYQQNPGLVQVPTETGALTWSIFSAPNELFRTQFHFYYDAFTIITMAQTLEQSVISLYNQDVREQAGFKRVGVFGLTSGENRIEPLAPVPGENIFIPGKRTQQKLDECAKKSDKMLIKEGAKARKDPIIIGCTLDLTKGASVPSKHVKAGISIRINEINASGGISGHPVKVIFMDDEYSPDKARQNVENFIKTYKSTLFLCNLGSPTLEAYVNMVKKNEIFLFFPITGAPIFRKKDLTSLVHWRASYENEAKMLVKYLINDYRIQSFGYLYQNDSYGVGALQGARAIQKEAKIPDGLEVSYERNTTLFKSQIDKFKAGTIQALGFFSTSLAATEFIRQAGVEFFIGKKLFALSDLSEQSFKKFVQEKGLDMVIAQFSPNPITSSLELVKDFRHALFSQGYSDQDIFTLEGYIGASFAIDILKKAYPSHSHEDILKVITAMKDYKYKGFTLSFNPETRELVHKLWLNTGQPDWLEIDIKDSL